LRDFLELELSHKSQATETETETAAESESETPAKLEARNNEQGWQGQLTKEQH